ncbi:hypothetical protein ACFQ3N_19480 [Virgibacillus byunsanensis]|uniref:Uncharacterized protein n=1 Tax=Virgibacillus byunsanensis TaxID=570945 RepID=A0ABW3LQB4_9BACI
MAKRKFGMGWFGWTMISVILITTLGSFLFFVNVLDLDINNLFTDDQQASEETTEEPASQETVEEVEKVQDTVGKDHEDIGGFVSEMHDFYNDTTGYGGISSLDWNEQVEQAKTIDQKLQEEIPNITSDALLTDLQNIQNLASKTVEEQKSENVRNLHRLFHDLDIALNSYNGYDKIWGVTETLEQVN